MIFYDFMTSGTPVSRKVLNHSSLVRNSNLDKTAKLLYFGQPKKFGMSKLLP